MEIGIPFEVYCVLLDQLHILAVVWWR